MHQQRAVSCAKGVWVSAGCCVPSLLPSRCPAFYVTASRSAFVSAHGSARVHVLCSHHVLTPGPVCTVVRCVRAAPPAHTGARHTPPSPADWLPLHPGTLHAQASSAAAFISLEILTATSAVAVPGAHSARHQGCDEGQQQQQHAAAAAATSSSSKAY